jgi:hypothetical protein
MTPPKIVTSPLEPLTYLGVRACAGTQPPFILLGADNQPPHQNHHLTIAELGPLRIDRWLNLYRRLIQETPPSS